MWAARRLCAVIELHVIIGNWSDMWRCNNAEDILHDVLQGIAVTGDAHKNTLNSFLACDLTTMLAIKLIDLLIIMLTTASVFL